MHKPIIPFVIAAALQLSVLAAPVMAQQPAPQQAPLTVQENAPDSYVVQKGDTLWAISGKFLKEPWRWPEIWQMNKDQVKNPHWIYPGDIIVLDRSGGSLRLRLAGGGSGGGGGDGTVKLSPRARGEALAAFAIPSIPASEIEPFLSQPLVIENGGLDKAPRIVATEESRLNLGPGYLAYVTGIPDGKENLWQIYRPRRPLIDPDSQKTLGYEAEYIGAARYERGGEPATLRIVSAAQEISSGDRLVPAGPPVLINYVPHAPQAAINARVISLYGSRLGEGGRNSIISISKGKRDGLELGHVLALYRRVEVIDESKPVKWYEGRSAKTIQLPDERYGLIFVFRVFDQVSYALVLDSSRSVFPLDFVRNP